MAKEKKPAYNVRYKDERGYWHQLGVAFETEAGGKPALSLKLNLIPVGWDGSALMMEPKENESAD